MEVFMRKPSIDLYPGVRVDRGTEFEYKNKNVEQSLKELVFRSVTHVKGDGYTSTHDTVIELKEGDVLVFEEEGRGYIKPVEDMVTVREAISELECIKELR